MKANAIERNDALLGQVQSVVRAFGILNELAKCERLTLAELAGAVDLPKSTTHRLLTTLEAVGHVRFDRRTSRWAVGLQAFNVGAAFARTRDLGPAGRSVMRSLAAEVRHCVNLAVIEGDGICYLDQTAGEGYRPTAARPGAVLPLHTTASGKVLMAQWSQPELDRYFNRGPLRPRTERSMIDPAGLRDDLAAIRARGFALDDEEHEMGLRCIATVVCDANGKPSLALSISDRSPHLGRDRLNALSDPLTTAARQLAHLAGLPA